MSKLMNDVRYASRHLCKSPGFTLVAVLTLALGIGANITMFSVVNAILLRPLPFENPDRLVVVQQHNKQFDITTWFSYPDFLDFKEQNQAFEDLAAYTAARFDVPEHDGICKIDGATVSSNFFSLLRVSACLGRTFTQADQQQNSTSLAVISHDFWQSKFAQDKEVVSQTITLNDKIHTIIGVLPAGFSYPDMIGNAQVWTVLNPTNEQSTSRIYTWLRTVGRLKAGLSIEQALPLLNQLHRRLTQTYGMPDGEVQMHGLCDMVVRDVRTTLWLLSVIVGFILLIVCANVANLCLARASTRDREVAIRGALGANKLQLLRQFTTESVLLSLAGGAAGLIITVCTIILFRVKISGFVPLADSIGIDPSVLIFGLGISLLVGIFIGIAPFWFMQRCRLTDVLTERRSSSVHHARLSNMLVAGQIAIALVLSIGMSLMIRSMMRFSSADTGFNRENLMTFSIGMDQRDEPQRYQFIRNFQSRLSSLPYVKGVSTDSSMPCSTMGACAIVTAEGYTSPDGKPVWVPFHNVGPDYFKTLQIPIQSGRDISLEEHQEKERVVVISESLARQFWPNQNAIDRELTFSGQPYRVVGIVGDMIQGDVKGGKCNHMFLPFDTMTMREHSDLKVVVRASSDPGMFVEQARAILRDIDATLPLYDISTFKAQMNRYLSQERFTTIFLVVFASIALLLIVIGIYGVVSYAVTQRTREIGIRMALGAHKIGILAMILKQGLILLMVGLVVGVAGAIGLTRFLAGYLYDVSTTDPVSFVLAPLIITIVSMLACFVPAGRAAKTDPMEALRYE
ncbi:MAG: ABC transporter permease [Sedimentisphaerales bacterium]|nr:ABC transporter permease [Sedimentisphaerales bacterium]